MQVTPPLFKHTASNHPSSLRKSYNDGPEAQYITAKPPACWMRSKAS